MNILQREFGKPEDVLSWVVGELSRLKPVTNDKLFVEFVNKVEKICRDLEAVGMKKGLMNVRMTSDIVSKLPPVIAQKWTEYKNMVGDQSSEKNFEEMNDFIQVYKKITKNLNPEHQFSNQIASTRVCFVTGQTHVTQQSPPQQISRKSCLVCEGGRNPRDAQHWTLTCEKWKSMNLMERRRIAKCWRHPFDNHTFAS